MFLKPAFEEALAEEPDRQVKTVYVIYKCHLDVGFTDTEHGVIRTYFDDYFPRAMDTAEVLRRSAKIYWVDDWILQIVVFAMVLSLIDQAISHSQWRRLSRTGLAAGATLFASISFFIHYLPHSTKLGLWMTPWTRDLSFCATILDLALWMILIASRKKDRRLLLISGALGLRFTGDDIGEAVLSLSTPRMMETLALSGSVIVMLADLACLYFWWQTFRTARTVPVAAA